MRCINCIYRPHTTDSIIIEHCLALSSLVAYEDDDIIIITGKKFSNAIEKIGISILILKILFINYCFFLSKINHHIHQLNESYVAYIWWKFESLRNNIWSESMSYGKTTNKTNLMNKSLIVIIIIKFHSYNIYCCIKTFFTPPKDSNYVFIKFKIYHSNYHFN